jgi:hypothetical protein
VIYSDLGKRLNGKEVRYRMHYKNGREAKVGDRIVGVDSSGHPVAGVLVEANAGSTTCNGNVVPFNSPTWCITLGDCLHVEDFKAESKEKKEAPADRKVE